MKTEELSEPDMQLNNARINLRDSIRLIDELLQGKVSPNDRNPTVAEIVGKIEWAVQYLYRSIEQPTRVGLGPGPV